MARRRRRPRRLPTLIVLGLVFMAVASRQLDAPRQRAAAVVLPGNPEVRADATSASWFCPGGTAVPQGIANVTVNIANVGSAPSSVTLTTAPTSGAPVSAHYTVAASSRLDINLATLGAAPFVSASVETDGGEIVVEQSVNGSLGADIAPCATSASQHWSIATASTARDDAFLVFLYNPFPEAAVADIAVSDTPLSASGVAVAARKPGGLQGISVPARSLIVSNLGDSVRRQDELAITVSTRTGRLIAGRVQAYNAEQRRGLLAGPGVPATSSLWVFPANLVSASSVEVLHLYNPDPDNESVVEVSSVLDSGLVEPQVLTVPAGGHLVVNVNDAKRIPPDIPHTLLVRRFGGVPLIAERVLARPGDALIGSVGLVRGAKTWTMSTVGGLPGAQLALVNLSTSASATVTITSLAGGVASPVGSVTLKPGRRIVFSNPALTAATASAVKVVSNTPIAVERVVNGPTGPLTLAPAVPIVASP